MGMRDNHRVERSGVERKLAVGAVGIHPIRVKQPAVEQNPSGPISSRWALPVICRAAPWNVIRNQATSRTIDLV